MSKQIDERVVSMQFDNAVFEKNIQKSLKSVDDLNKSLNNLDGAKGFDELNKAVRKVDMDPLIDSAQQVQKEFSKMELISAGAMLNIGKQLSDFGLKIGKKLWNNTFGQIQSGGWKRASDIKAGKFMLEGLKFTAKQVEDISDAASRAVKDTAAGLGEAMKTAGTLATSGLTDTEEMFQTLRGIAGVSAMTNRSFEEIGHIFSTISSNGKLMTMQLRQLSFAGINASAVLAKHLGKTEAKINDMVTKGAIDFKTFGNIMYEEFGEHATEANKTFTGALANMKAALSRIGERFSTPYMDAMKNIFNNLRQIFNAVNKAMEPVYQDFEKIMAIGQKMISNVLGRLYTEDEKGRLDTYSSSLDNLVAIFRNLYTTVFLIVNTIGDALREAFSGSFEDATEGIREFTASIIPTADALKILKTVLTAVFKLIAFGIKVVRELAGIAGAVIEVVVKLAYAIIGSFANLDKMTGGLLSLLKSVNLVEVAMDILCGVIFGVGAAITGLISLVASLFDTISGYVNFDELKNIGVYIIEGIVNGIYKAYTYLKNIWNAIIEFLPESMRKALKIASPSKVFLAIGGFIMAGLIAGLLRGKIDLGNFLDSILGAFQSFGTFIIGVANAVGDNLAKAFGGLSDIFKGVKKKLDELNLKKTNKQLEQTAESAEKVVSSASETIAESNKSNAKTVEETNEEIGSSFGNMAVKIGDTLGETSKYVNDKLTEMGINIDAFKIVLVGLGAALITSFTKANFGFSILGPFDKLISMLAIIAGASIIFKTVDFSPAIEGLKTLFDNLKTIADQLDIVNAAKRTITAITDFFRETNLAGLAAKTLVFASAIVMIQAVHNIGQFFLEVGTTFKTIATAFKSLTAFKFGLYESAADRVLKIAISISAIAASIALLAQVPVDGLNRAVAVILFLTAIILSFNLMAAKLAKNKGQAILASSSMKQINSLALTMMTVTASIILLAMLTESASTESWVMAFGTLATMYIAFGVLIKNVASLDLKGINIATVLAIGALGIAIGYTMHQLMSAFSDIPGPEIAKRVLWAGVVLAGITAALVFLFKSIKEFDVYEEKTEHFTKRKRKGLFGILGAIVGESDDKSKKRVTDSFGKDTWKIISSMALLIGAIGGIITLFGKVLGGPKEEIIQNLGGVLIGIAGTLGLLWAIAKIFEKNKKSFDTVSKFGMALAVITGIFVAGMMALANMDEKVFFDALSKMTWVVFITSAIFTLFSFLATLIVKGSHEATMTIKGIGVTVAGLALGLSAFAIIFSLMPEDRLKEFADWAMRLVFWVTLFFALMNTITAILTKDAEGDEEGAAKSGLMNMIALVAGLATLMMSIVFLSFIDPYQLMVPLVAVTTILVALGFVIHAMGAISEDLSEAKGSIIALSVVTGLIFAMFTALAILEGQNMVSVDALWEIATVISALLAVMALFIGIMSSIAKDIDKGQLLAIAIFGGIIVGLTAALLGLSNIPHEDLINVIYVVAAVTAAISVLMMVASKAVGASAVIYSIAGAIAAFGLAILEISAGVAGILIAWGAALLAFSYAMQMLESVDLHKISSGLNEIALSLLLVGAAAAVGIALVGTAIAITLKEITAVMIIAAAALGLIGYFLMQGLAKGIYSNDDKVYKAGFAAGKAAEEGVRDATDTRSPSKVFKDIGGFLMDGLNSGIIGGLPIVGKTLEEGMGSICDWLFGMSDQLEEVGDTWGNVVSIAFADKLGNMDIFGGLGGDKENSFSKKLEDAYNKLGLTGDEADSASDSLFNFGKSLPTNELDEFNSSMNTSIDMFEQFDDAAHMTSRSVLPAFMSQLEGVSKWQSELESLSARGLGEVIIQELANMGPEAYEKVHAIYQMTDAELSMMNIMYHQKLSLQNKTKNGIKNSFKKLPGEINGVLEDGFDQTGNVLVDQMDDLGSRMMKALKKQIDYQKVIDQVTGFRDNVADKIRSSMSIFEAVNEQEKESVEDLLDNMKSQVKHVGRWATMITELAAKGYDEGLVAMLTDMGPQSYSKVEAFLSANEAQIAEANRLYRASEEVPNYGADKIVKAFAQAGYNASMGLTDSFLEGLDPEAVEQAMWDLGQTSITTLLDSIANNPYDIGYQEGVLYADGLQAALEDTASKNSKTDEDIADTIKSLYPEDYLEKEAMAAIERKKQYDANTTGRVVQKIKKDLSEPAVGFEEGGNQYTYDDAIERAISKGVTEYWDVKTKKDKRAGFFDIGAYEKQYYPTDFVQVGPNKDVTDYDIDKFVKTGGLIHLRELEQMGDEEAGKLADYVEKIYNQINNDTEKGIYRIGYYNGETYTNASIDALEDNTESIAEAGDKVANTMIGSVAGYGGMPSNVPIMRNHADALKDTPLAKGFGMISDASMQVFADSAVEKGEELIPEAIGHLHDLTLESLTLALSDILDRLSGEEDDVTLGIRPVIDFLDDPIGSIKDMFDRNPVDLSASMKIDTSRKDSTKNNQLDILSRLNQMIDQQATTNTQLGQIYNKDSNVYMNSGALVGQIGHDVDRYLGVQANYARRGLA